MYEEGRFHLKTKNLAFRPDFLFTIFSCVGVRVLSNTVFVNEHFLA